MRRENAVIHNRAQPVRRIENALWKRIASELTPREAACLAVVATYFRAVVRERLPRLDVQDATLLEAIVPWVNTPSVQVALGRFRRVCYLCTVCGEHTHNLRVLPDCMHPVCIACWKEGSPYMERHFRVEGDGETSGVIVDFYVKCRACGSRNWMEDDEENYLEKKYDATNFYMLKKLDKIRVDDGMQGMQGAQGAQDPEAAKEVARRIDAVKERFQKTYVFALDHCDLVSRRELALFAEWLATASGRRLEVGNGGRFAWC